MTTDAVTPISDRMNPIQPSSTLAMTAKAKALKAEGKPVVSLAAGEPDFAVPHAIQEAMIASLQQGFTRYTPTSGIPDLKQAVAEKFATQIKLPISAQNVVISCGAKHSLYNLMQVLVNPGDEVMIPRPYWVSYPEMVRLAGAHPIEVDTSQQGYHMTAELIEKAITPKTKAIIINSPSNPTGAVLSGKEIKDIAELVLKKKLFVISDEIYEHYVYDGREHISIASLLGDQWSQHSAVVNGVSKSYAMTGLRIGYTAAHPNLIKAIGMLQDHSTSNPVSLSQKGAIAALKLENIFAADLKNIFMNKRNQIMQLASEIPQLEPIEPEGAFYLFASVAKTGLSPADFSRRLLEEAYVATIPGEGFGSSNSVRLSFATSSEAIQEGMTRMKQWAAKL